MRPEIDSEILPEILYRTERWWVVGKPAGWLTIPGRGGAESVLSAWLERVTGEKAWVIHRIDRETSGLVVFARTASAHREANSWFQKHQVKKTYEFLAAGNPTRPIFKVTTPIEGAPSTTQIEVKERYGEAFFGKAFPLTGRRHQIRIHLSGEKSPLLGDSRYGGPLEVSFGAEGLKVPRVALHAARIEFPGGEIFESAWPKDFGQWVEVLRKYRK